MSNANVFVEFHALTSHVPANLNRDDQGSPKTAVFGNVRRLRISSQCLKRTWRISPWFNDEMGEEELGIRTQLAPADILEKLEGRGAPLAGARAFVEMLATIGKKPKAAKDAEDGTDEAEGPSAVSEGDRGASAVDEQYEAPSTAHLLYLSRQEIEALVALGESKAAELDASGKAAQEKDAKGKPTKAAKAAEKDLAKSREAILKDIKQALKDSGPLRAVDIALFGRFVTAEEINSINAALQVAHAIGTGEVDLETDYFSAVDDLNTTSTGAAHIGDAEFASAVFYKYAVCDTRVLLENLENDVDLASRVFRALTQAIARAVPRGKKNSTAPQNPADYLMITVRRGAPVSLANAFLRPARPDRKNDLMHNSIEALRNYAHKLDEVYGTSELLARLTLSTRDEAMSKSLEREKVAKSLTDLAGQVAALVKKTAAAPTKVS